MCTGRIFQSQRERETVVRERYRERDSVIARKPNTTTLVEDGCSNDVKHFMKLFTFCIR